MPPTYQRIAYDGFEVANPTNLQSILAMIGRADPRAGDVALDIGAGGGAVSVAMAKAHALTVHAIERDPELAATIRARVAGAGAEGLVHVHAENSATVLTGLPPVDLIVALGTTDAAGVGVRDPRATFRALASKLKRPGHILWGDLVWKRDPPDPLRQIIAMSGDYASDEGWRAAGADAGLDCVATEASSEEDWDAYFGGADRKVRAWLAAHPDVAEAEAIRARADQIKATFDFGRHWLGFGLYLFRNG